MLHLIQDIIKIKKEKDFSFNKTFYPVIFNHLTFQLVYYKLKKVISIGLRTILKERGL